MLVMENCYLCRDKNIDNAYEVQKIHIHLHCIDNGDDACRGCRGGKA